MTLYFGDEKMRIDQTSQLLKIKSQILSNLKIQLALKGLRLFNAKSKNI